jgi:hypothetical protein
MEVMAGKLEWQKYLNEKAKIDAEYEEALKKAEIQHKLNSGSGGGSTAAKKYPVYNAEGDVIEYCYTPEEAKRRTIKAGGEWDEHSAKPMETEETIKTTTDARGKTKTVTSKKVKNGNGKKANPMATTNQSSQGKKKKINPMSD